MNGDEIALNFPQIEYIDFEPSIHTFKITKALIVESNLCLVFIDESKCIID